MKLHEAMKKALLEFGVSVLRERRFFYLLSDYHAFEDFPAMKEVAKALSDGGYGEKLLLMSQEPGRTRYESCVKDVRKFLSPARGASRRSSPPTRWRASPSPSGSSAR